jgi:hypothetical protein
MQALWEQERALTPPVDDVQACLQPYLSIGLDLHTVTTTYRGAYPTRAAVLIYRSEIAHLTPSVGTDTV